MKKLPIYYKPIKAFKIVSKKAVRCRIFITPDNYTCNFGLPLKPTEKIIKIGKRIFRKYVYMDESKPEFLIEIKEK